GWRPSRQTSERSLPAHYQAVGCCCWWRDFLRIACQHDPFAREAGAGKQQGEGDAGPFVNDQGVVSDGTENGVADDPGCSRGQHALGLEGRQAGSVLLQWSSVPAL